ncbi:MarR family winged helix-turn-helix transcriptional regulator [Phaeacidiphilus oryzae]|uniref:MarR family winged helix-turn-helix transcriptional regulator n=1 Tax=Phaeacidiphilus oryzae TaxID=348818 RepID=UPI000A07807F|nr:MarR family transcriptional regulator [Phaeacidiphilus oryzae]
MTNESTLGARAGGTAGVSGVSGASDADAVYDQLQYQVAIFARRVEQVRFGGLGAVRNSMDRAAFLVLTRLSGEGPMGVKALAQSMGVDSSTVTRQVAPLVENGLVERVPNPSDGRAVLLDLSPRGRDRLNELRRSRGDLMRQMLADWPDEERAAFTELLTKFNLSMRAYRSGRDEPGQEAEAADEEPAARA